MDKERYIGIDLGGTNVRAGALKGMEIIALESSAINSQGTEQEVLNQIFDVIEALDMKGVAGIGIGVPSTVNTTTGTVYDVQNIPSWKEVRIKEILETRYGIETRVNNDANCFAMAEQHFGMGVNHTSFVGLIIGTGLAAGIIIDGKIYEGANCGAGEFGMIRYLDHYYEYYCSGQYFESQHGINGAELYRLAESGDENSLKIFQDYGTHLGHAFETIMYAYDPKLIVLGGSVSKAFHFYQPAVSKVLQGFAYHKSIEQLEVKVSDLQNGGVLGAAALHFTSDDLGQSI